jgi:hypothetical protein
MEGDLWGAAKAEISIPMPDPRRDQHREGMAEHGLADMSPDNQAIFPGCAEEQVGCCVNL